MPSAQVTLDVLRLETAFMDNVAAWERLPADPGRHSHTPDGLDGHLVEAVRRHLEADLDTQPLLYTHQSRAIETALRGENVVVVSGTASGKTLCYNLPVLDTLIKEPAARALYLFPTKALAQDQTSQLSTFIDLLPASSRPVVSTYDGDTPRSQRSRIRREARVLVTNPDMLHTGILPHHTRWLDLFSNLSYVVLDELHAYRGVFGSHVANVLRRMRRICAFHGASPQFVCASATIANPKELAEKLIEEPVALVEDDGAARAAKHFILYNPPLMDTRLGLRRAYTLETSKVAGRFIADDVQTIIFARARTTAELLLGYIRDQACNQGVDKDTIRGYRGGYLPTERREIERGLRTGEVRGVVATNALELGVDIGQLGAAIIAGYPGTIASLWQQAGRAGRRSEVSAVVFVASGAPLDQYIALHPRYIFENSAEHGLINPDNVAILVRHLRCALFELPFAAGESFGTLDHLEEVLQIMIEQGEVHLSTLSAIWIGDTYPAADISLRTAHADKVLINDVSGDEPITIGEVDLDAAPLLTHSGAVYMHEGRQYLVETLNWEIKTAEVRQAEMDYYTRASEDTSLTVLRVLEADETQPACSAHGNVLVRTQPTHFRKVKLYTHEVLGYGDIDLPSREFETSAYWLWVSLETVRQLENQGLSLSPNYYGPNWQYQRKIVRAMAKYRCQRCGDPEIPHSTLTGSQHDVHHVRPFRQFGYIRGQNENYREANVLDNLILLCRRCHHRTEASYGNHSALSGLAHVLTNLAPLHLMCDPNDISSTTELHGKETGAPTITIIDHVPGGIGLSECLYELRGKLLSGAHELIYSCPCTQGCPACVGPVLEVPHKLPSLKQLTIQLAEALL